MNQSPISSVSRTFVVGALSLGAFAGPLLAQDPPKKPIRINDYIGGPDYLRFSGQHRTRFESLNGQFRSGNTRDTEDQLFNRSILRVDYTRNEWGATLEGLDGRAFGTHDDSFADTTTVNTLDVLQASASYAFTPGSKVTVGRFTMDIGSRRLVARNEYRNTINSFNGVRWDGVSEDKDWEAGAFWTMPTNRRPSDRMMLVDNEHDWDSQTTDYQFFGAHATRNGEEGRQAQVYAFGLRDSRGSTDDWIWTIGTRQYRPSRPGHAFGEVELAYQFGERGAQDIDARFAHGSIGYTCDCDMEPSVRAAIDYASGDDAGDGDYERFNTLFGARRFEYGPTGIYGAIGRRNLVSPELRFSIRPTDTTWVMLGWRYIRRDTVHDAWAEAGDNSGQGQRIGQQTELRLRWEPCKSNMRFEVGGAYLAGSTFRETSTAGRSSDTRYFFAETIFTF